MTESWAVRHKRKRDYFHHVVSLDRIYTEEQQKAKIKQTIDSMQKISKHKVSTLANERDLMSKSIIIENCMIDKKMNEKTGHYTEHVLRPQIGRTQPTLLSQGVLGPSSPINHHKTMREAQNKLINKNNKQIVSRLKFITSSFSQDKLKATFKRPLSPRLIKKHIGKNMHSSLYGRTGSVQVDINGVTDKFKERVFKGVTFKASPDPFILYIGKNMPKNELYHLLDELKEKRRRYESRFVPERTHISQTFLGNQSTSKMFPYVREVSIPLKKMMSDSSIQETKGEDQNSLEHSPKMARLPLKDEIREKKAMLMQRRLEEEQEQRKEFVQVANGLFRPEIAREKKVTFSFTIKSASHFTQFFVTAQGLTTFQNIGSKGDLQVPWSVVLDNPVVELEFMNQAGQSERVLFDLMKRHQKISLIKLVGYKVSVAVSVD